MDYWSRERGPFLFAHRGACQSAPENSLPAFRAAVEQGADAIETDAHMSADSQVVISHDPDGGRLAGQPRAIRDCTLAEVQGWCLGRQQGRPVHPPSLAQVLQELPDVPLNLDLKQTRPDMSGAAMEAIAAAGASDRVLLTSFSGATLGRVRAAGYPGPIGLSQSDAFHAFFSTASALRRRPLGGVRLQVPPRHGPLLLARPALLDKLHGVGVSVDFWVVNDPAQAIRLLDLGADGLVTDLPGVLAEVFRTHPRTGGWRQRHGWPRLDGGSGPQLARPVTLGYVPRDNG